MRCLLLERELLEHERALRAVDCGEVDCLFNLLDQLAIVQIVLQVFLCCRVLECPQLTIDVH